MYSLRFEITTIASLSVPTKSQALIYTSHGFILANKQTAAQSTHLAFLLPRTGR